LGAVAAAGTAAAACSSSSTPAATPAAAPECPTSFAAASGASCTLSGQTCDLLAPCGAFGAPATCTCAGGVFACVASSIGDAGGGGVPCTASTPPPTCPSTETRASEAACTALGQQCSYPSACASIPAYDVCQCVGGEADADEPHFECLPSCDVPDATASAPDARAADASITDANTPDGVAIDAPSDASSPLDGASD
jgi:hypothetical protein